MKMLRSVELSIVNSSKALTWRVSCRCWLTGNSSWGYPRRLFGGSAYVELDGKRRDSDLHWFGPSKWHP
jgi:hypothetical protein